MTPHEEGPRQRARDLGITIGTLPTGPLNAITDVAGVRVGHVTLTADTPAVVRTGVTAILPFEGPNWTQSVFAGFDAINGFGEVAGSHWIREAGILSSPICLGSAFQIGTLRDALLALPFQEGVPERWHQPCAGETYDGLLNDGLSRPITADHVRQAIAAAASGPVAEGCVGGGTGMMAYEFKAGIGTSSRQVQTAAGAFTVGVLVQANYGNRKHLTIDGVPVGRQLGYEVVDSPQRRDEGSLIMVVATDAPLLPPQCTRLARRAMFGLGRVGGFGSNRSGDFTIAFSTGNRLPWRETRIVEGLRMMPNEAMNPLFVGVAEATEEAIVNALTMAHTTIGKDGTTVHAIPLDRLARIMAAARPG